MTLRRQQQASSSKSVSSLHKLLLALRNPGLDHVATVLWVPLQADLVQPPLAAAWRLRKAGGGRDERPLASL